VVIKIQAFPSLWRLLPPTRLVSAPPIRDLPPSFAGGDGFRWRRRAAAARRGRGGGAPPTGHRLRLLPRLPVDLQEGTTASRAPQFKSSVHPPCSASVSALLQRMENSPWRRQIPIDSLPIRAPARAAGAATRFRSGALILWLDRLGFSPVSRGTPALAPAPAAPALQGYDSSPRRPCICFVLGGREELAGYA
jgi:hypothetical protein